MVDRQVSTGVSVQRLLRAIPVLGVVYVMLSVTYLRAVVVLDELSDVENFGVR